MKSYQKPQFTVLDMSEESQILTNSNDKFPEGGDAGGEVKPMPEGPNKPRESDMIWEKGNGAPSHELWND